MAEMPPVLRAHLTNVASPQRDVKGWVDLAIAGGLISICALRGARPVRALKCLLESIETVETNTGVCSFAVPAMVRQLPYCCQGSSRSLLHGFFNNAFKITIKAA